MASIHALNPAAASTLDKLKAAAKTQGGDTQALLRRFAVERFLARVAASEWAERVVLKGGTLILAWAQDEARPTEDIDVKLTVAPADAADFVADMCRMPVSQDGLRFDTESIAAESIRAGCLPGARVKLFAYLDTGPRPVEIRVKLDLAWGDAVCEGTTVVLPPVLRGFEPVRMRAATVEDVVADKLHAVARHGLDNSRLKDFYDVVFLYRKMAPDALRTAAAIVRVFNAWGCPVSAELPGLSEEFAAQNEGEWAAFKRAKKGLHLQLGSLSEVLSEVRLLTATALAAAVALVPVAPGLGR